MTQLAQDYARFCAVLTAGEKHFANSDYHAAAGLAHLAACYAFPANVGLFSSPRLEGLLLDLGKHVATDLSPGPADRGDKKRLVLHVLSYAKPIGGDSRFAWRWIQQDQSSRHAVVITTQADVAQTYEIPSELKDAVLASGGFVHILQAPRSMPMESARELRAMCQRADTVVLHSYPYDIVPVLALAAGCDSAKTLYVNHSDHTFWVGSSVAHSIAHLRTQSPQFLRRRRGLNVKLSSLLPIPLDRTLPSVSREEAKRALGYCSDDVVLLTIASPFKYSSPGQVEFLGLVTPVVAQSPQVKLIAVGPDRSGAWEAASVGTGGRIIPIGRRWGNELLYAAADVYLDSVPFSSITSLLEAGINGVPLLGFTSTNPELGLLGPGAPGLENAMLVASDPDAYRAQLLRLIGDEKLRHDIGERTRAQILSIHGEANWLKNLEEVYATLERTGNRGCLEERRDRFEPGALSLALVQLFEQVQGRLRVRQLIARHIGSLPYLSRLSITWRLRCSGLDLCYLNLLPPPIDSIARRIGRRAKAMFAAKPSSWAVATPPRES